jgi:hypothetical protein
MIRRTRAILVDMGIVELSGVKATPLAKHTKPTIANAPTQATEGDTFVSSVNLPNFKNIEPPANGLREGITAVASLAAMAGAVAAPILLARSLGTGWGVAASMLPLGVSFVLDKFRPGSAAADAWMTMSLTSAMTAAAAGLTDAPTAMLIATGALATGLNWSFQQARRGERTVFD